MKRFILLFAIMLGTTAMSFAQTYLEHIQQKTPGLGSITVTQSKAIDELVNGKQVATTNEKKATTTPQDIHTKTTPSTTPNKNNKVSEPQKKLTPDSVKKPEHHEPTAEKPAAHEAPVKKTETEKEENETPMVDMRKKVMRGSYKVTGYRVQAYAGGNSRNDRLKADCSRREWRDGARKSGKATATGPKRSFMPFSRRKWRGDLSGTGKMF